MNNTIMNNKLAEGAESFKQFVIDEYTELFNQYQKLEFTKNELLKKSDAMTFKNKEISRMYLELLSKFEKVSNENDRMFKTLSTTGNITKIELLKNQNLAMAASHANLIGQNKILSTQLDKARYENNALILDSKRVRNSNTNLKNITSDLIKFLDSIGYNVDINPVKANIKSLKNVLGKKYHVEEVKPEAAKESVEPVFNVETLKNMLVKGLGDQFEVHVIGGENADKFLKDKFLKDLFGNPITEKKKKRNDNRDNKGRYSSPSK